MFAFSALMRAFSASIWESRESNEDVASAQERAFSQQVPAWMRLSSSREQDFPRRPYASPLRRRAWRRGRRQPASHGELLLPPSALLSGAQGWKDPKTRERERAFSSRSACRPSEKRPRSRHGGHALRRAGHARARPPRGARALRLPSFWQPLPFRPSQSWQPRHRCLLPSRQARGQLLF